MPGEAQDAPLSRVAGQPTGFAPRSSHIAPGIAHGSGLASPALRDSTMGSYSARALSIKIKGGKLESSLMRGVHQKAFAWYLKRFFW